MVTYNYFSVSVNLLLMMDDWKSKPFFVDLPSNHSGPIVLYKRLSTVAVADYTLNYVQVYTKRSGSSDATSS